MATRMRSARPQKARPNTAEERMIEHVGTHVPQAKPTSINFLRQYIKRQNQQIELEHISAAQRGKLELQRDYTFQALRMFQDAFAKGDLEARAAVEFSRRQGVILQDDATATEAHSPSPLTMKRHTPAHNGESVVSYTPRPGSMLRRSFVLDQESERDVKAVAEMEAVLKSRSLKKM